MQNIVLCIIDMQPYFSASQNPLTIEACQLEIIKAIKNGYYIFFVEWEGEGATDNRLTSLTESYSKVHFIFKNQDEGSSVIMRKVYDLGIVNSKFKVCGVNTDACVKTTVIGLAEYGRAGRPVEVISKACNTDWGTNYSALAYISTVNNVKVVY